MLLILLSVTCASASQNETVLNDDSNEPLQIDEEIKSDVEASNDEIGSYSELEEEFLKGGTFNFTKDYAADGPDNNIINIKKSIVIDGQGHSIDAKGYKGIFQADSSESDNIHIVIKNLVFKNGKKDYGAAIYITEVENVILELINCRFENNHATKQGGAIYFVTYSSNEASQLVIKGSVFENNQAEKEGGALYLSTADTYLIEGSTFNNNIAGTEGGVIYANSKKFIHPSLMRITDSTFNNNRANSGGGAAIYHVSTIFLIYNSHFEENEAKGEGGTIYSQGNLEIYYSSFKLSKSHGNNGGAIYYNHEEGDLRITNSEFRLNTAGNNGGAIYIKKDKDIYIIDCNFTLNSGGSDDGATCGGAIYNDGSGKLFLVHSIFADNIVNSQFNPIKDFKGGAIYTEGDIDIAGCYFGNNFAKDQGGAIYTNGGIFWHDETSIFDHNSVRTDIAFRMTETKGGAIYASTFKNTAKGIVFRDNRAGYGGAIYINNKNDITFESCYFECNSAEKYWGGSCGAAIYIDSSASRVSLINNYFNGNRADNDWGVFTCGSYKTISHNWWGTNNPNFEDKYMVQWNPIISNDNHVDPDYLNIIFTGDAYLPAPEESGKLILQFVDKNGNNFTGKILLQKPHFGYTWGVHDEKIGDNNATAIFTPHEAGKYTIQARLSLSYPYEYYIYFNVTVGGAFDYLQQLVNEADGVLDLHRDFVYSQEDNVDTITNGITINKPLIINGNGHTIDAKDKSRIFLIDSDNVIINNITLINGNALNQDGSAILVTSDNKNVIINNSKFINNHATGKGGAIYTVGVNSKVVNCSFEKNSADIGGAIYTDVNSEGTVVDYCRFVDNSGSHGGAIVWCGDGRISNSIFLSNKADINSFTVEKTDKSLIITMEGKENCMNAIDIDIDFDDTLTITNVTYWNGEIVNSDEPPINWRAVGQNITIEIFKKDSDGNLTLVKNSILLTNISGQAKYDFNELEDGNYTFRVFHKDDAYYAASENITGEFYAGHWAPYASSINITTPNATEFEYGKVNIRFVCDNRTMFRIFVTNLNGSEIYEDYIGSYDYYDGILPVSEEYYKITVYNIGDENHRLSKDSILFKVCKTSSTVKIDSLPEEIHYPQNVSVTFEGDYDCHDYNVTIYDENNTIVFNSVVFVAQTYGSMRLPVLNSGEYNITIINLGNKNKNASNVSGHFKTFKIINNITVSVDDGVFGRNTTVTVRADIDGEYVVKINNRNVTVNVVNGTGSESIELGAGNYTASVTFDENYENNATIASFIVEKAEPNIYIDGLDSVAFDEKTTILLGDDYSDLYNVTVYSGNEVKFNAIVDGAFELPALEEGKYNLTVTNLGNENITRSSYSVIFNVTRNNYVISYVYDSYYGRNITIFILADVNGNYTVDINGVKVNITVEDGYGFKQEALDLDTGNYTAYVSFNNAKYNNIFTNGTFTIFEAESDVYIYDIEDVAYGETVHIDFNDPFPLEYYVMIMDSNSDVVYETSIIFNASDKLSINITNLPVGVYTVYLDNLGNNNIIASNDMYTFKVLGNKLSVSDMTRGYNSGADFSATVTDQDGNPVANINVTFTINGQKYVATTNAQGIASINPKLNVGTYKVTVTDPLSGENITKTLNIVKRITENKNVNTYYAKNYQYKLRIIGDDGKAVKAGVTVTVTVNGKAQTLKTDKNGYITLKFTKKYLPKTYKITATYKGFKIANKVVVKKVLKLKKVKVKKSAKKLILKATLKEGKKALKGKKVIFKFKGKKYKAKTNKKGIAKVTIKKKVLKKLKPGKKVKYQVTYLKCSVKRTAKVKR